MAFFYFLPVLVAIGFLLAHAARGGTFGVSPRKRLLAGAAGIALLAAIGLAFAFSERA
jgi:hypothetical protein